MTAAATAARVLAARGVQPRPWLATLHAHQAAMVADPSPRRAVLCSRRAGKSYAMVAWLLDGAASSPGLESLYVCQTRGLARRVAWSRGLEPLCRRLGIPADLRTEDGALAVDLPSLRHRIWLAGCSDRGETAKFRGPSYSRAVVDEAQSYGDWLGELLDDAIEPALLDAGGDLALAGTPGPVCAGLFFSATTTAPGWSRHHWTVRENPFIPHAAAWLARRRAEQRWTETHPTYRREWLGEWVQDEGALVYPYTAARNAEWGPPGDAPGEWRRVLGVDLGSSEHEPTTAFAVLATRSGSPEIHVERAWKRAAMTPSSVAAAVQAECARQSVDRVVVDAGGLGGAYVREMRERYGVACEPAEKAARRAAIEVVRGDLLSGVLRVRVQECQALIDEWSVLEWDGPVDHAADAVLYAHRALRSWYRPEEATPPAGTDEWWRREAAAVRAAAVREARQRGGQSGWGRR